MPATFHTRILLYLPRHISVGSYPPQYLTFRVIVVRAVPYHKAPMFVLSMQITMDLYQVALPLPTPPLRIPSTRSHSHPHHSTLTLHLHLQLTSTCNRK
jgi:hypothetical protein